MPMIAGRVEPRNAAMASPWRRRTVCTLVADRSMPAALYAISGRTAFVETDMAPPPGAPVELHHPEAGMIRAHVAAYAAGGLQLSLAGDAASTGFALAAIAADMSWPAR